MPVITKSVEEQLAVFRRGVVELHTEKQLRTMIESSLSNDRPLRIKFGMDPSSPDLHIGHAIPLMKLRDLQELGHQIVLIVGDSTAMVGDPTGRNKLRPQLTRADVERNLETYTAQAGLILDLERTEVRRNSEWFDEMGFQDVLALASQMTVAQMIERDTFQKRVRAKEPIGIHEFLYPLMQGWDSVKIECDVELGGNDQLFNILCGRDLQEKAGQRPQVCFTLPLINGLDGRKMSKSYGNAVGVTDTAREMVFNVMRLDDESMETWFSLLTRLGAEETKTVLSAHPREAKARLAAEIATFFHGEAAAKEAAEAFDREVRDKQLPTDIAEKAWPAADAEQSLSGLLKAIGLVASTSDARRMIEQGGVKLDGEAVKDVKAVIARPEAGVRVLVQVGKKRVAYLTN